MSDLIRPAEIPPAGSIDEIGILSRALYGGEIPAFVVPAEVYGQTGHAGSVNRHIGRTIASQFTGNDRLHVETYSSPITRGVGLDDGGHIDGLTAQVYGDPSAADRFFRPKIKLLAHTTSEGEADVWMGTLAPGLLAGTFENGQNTGAARRRGMLAKTIRWQFGALPEGLDAQAVYPVRDVERARIKAGGTVVFRSIDQVGLNPTAHNFITTTDDLRQASRFYISITP